MYRTGNPNPNADKGENHPIPTGMLQEEEEILDQEMQFERTTNYETISPTPFTNSDVREHERIYQLRETMDYCTGMTNYQ